MRNTDRTVADICFMVGLSSVGSFTTSFRRMFGMTPTQYRASFPSAAHLARVPPCVVKVYGRPQNRTFREDAPPALPYGAPYTNNTARTTADEQEQQS